MLSIPKFLESVSSIKHENKWLSSVTILLSDLLRFDADCRPWPCLGHILVSRSNYSTVFCSVVMHVSKIHANYQCYQWEVIQCTVTFEDMAEEYYAPEKTELVYNIACKIQLACKTSSQWRDRQGWHNSCGYWIWLSNLNHRSFFFGNLRSLTFHSVIIFTLTIVLIKKCLKIILGTPNCKKIFLR